MKIEVKQQFRDINDFSKIYTPGEIVDFEEERAKNIIALKLGVAVEKPKPKHKEKEVNDTELK